MGFLDDIVGVAKEFGALKQETTDTFSEVTSGLTDLKGEVLEPVSQLQDDASQIKDSVVNGPQDIQESIGQEINK